MPDTEVKVGVDVCFSFLFHNVTYFTQLPFACVVCDKKPDTSCILAMFKVPPLPQLLSRFSLCVFLKFEMLSPERIFSYLSCLVFSELLGFVAYFFVTNFRKFSFIIISNISSAPFSLSHLSGIPLHICYIFVIVPEFLDVLFYLLFIGVLLAFQVRSFC